MGSVPISGGGRWRIRAFAPRGGADLARLKPGLGHVTYVMCTCSCSMSANVTECTGRCFGQFRPTFATSGKAVEQVQGDLPSVVLVWGGVDQFRANMISLGAMPTDFDLFRARSADSAQMRCTLS